MLSSRLLHIGRSLLRTTGRKNPAAQESATRIQGSQQWEILWVTLTESAEKLGLTMIHLHINAPAIQETYTGEWQSPVYRDPGNHWEMRLPLLVAGHAVGFLEIAGENSGNSVLEAVELVQDMLEPFELRLKDFAEGAIVAKVGKHHPAKELEPLRRRSRRSMVQRPVNR